MSEMERPNPTADIDVRWGAYVEGRTASTNAHMVGGVPDYAFALDCSLRQKLTAIPGFKRLAKAMTSTMLPQMRQQHLMSNLKVGPTQLPQVYEMARDCARRLGIGMPDVFIEQGDMNAYAYAIEDDAPVIVIASEMIEHATPGELKACIGHECGHIHNSHGLFNILVEYITGGALQLGVILDPIVSLLSLPLQNALFAWSRAAEVTADRAGIICSDEPDDIMYLMGKLMQGVYVEGAKIDIDAIARQYDAIRDKPTRINEWMSTHPLGSRRVVAGREFLRSETLFSWRPEWRHPGDVALSKRELDARCEKYIGVFKSEKRKDA